MKRLFFLLLIFSAFNIAHAKVSLPAIFCDHMVMQRNSEVKLWGWANPTEHIKITTSWTTDTIKAVGDSQCNWSISLKTPEAGESHKITISGVNTIVLNDVLMGEVWLLSGQSNMEWNASYGIINGEEEIKNANHSNIRLFKANRRASNYPQDNLEGEWTICSPATMKNFSALGYIFGRTLKDSLNVPIGLISNAWGGSPIEIWIPEERITKNEYLLEESKKIKEMKWSAHEPGRAYNALVHPLQPYKIAGALWYQGETNAANPKAYTQMLSTLVDSWRKGFNHDFPFYYAQIAPWNGYGPTSGAMVREAQRRALNVIDKTGMVVVSDIGDTIDIHPRNKIDAGIRFANLALNKKYGKSQLPVSGPIYKSYSTNGKKVIVTFDYSEGLYVKGDALNMFEVKDNEGHWYSAKAKIKNNTIEVSNSKVKLPVGVRFAWSSSATPGLFNNEDLPASCFTSEKDME
ncbi:sialate O-acetylesterase [Labilibacter marinus]|uniref:sialate O-acetylesterase n=1 Tax=Labilibacter marinus TaxID=1477105 RepID=UPI00094FA303|nr:sialate O-acetylesterase [Labilibacter marinus]